MSNYRLFPCANLVLASIAACYLLWPFTLLRTWAVIAVASALLWVARRSRSAAIGAVVLAVRLIATVKPPTA